MLSISELSQDEIRYICKHIPLPMARSYFQAKPKEFAKIKPGFRPDKISDADTLSIILKNHKQSFVSVFLERVIKDWMSQIEENLTKLEDEGYSQGEALLKTLPESFFCENIELYFKLAGAEYSEDFLGIFKDALTFVQKEQSREDDEKKDSKNKEFNYAERLEEAHNTIQQLKVDLSKKQDEKIRAEITTRKLQEDLDKDRTELDKVVENLKKAQASISELESELDLYRRLDGYTDKDFEQSDYVQFQHISIGQISHDYSGQPWINRIADIVEGEIVPFYVDETEPRYFSNRDRLYWKNGPDEDGAIGIWNWKADVRDTDSTKDFITCEYNPDPKIIEIIEFSQCKTMSELISFLVNGFDLVLPCNKMLFVFSNSNGVKEGVLCNSGELEESGTKIRLRSSVYKLPCFHIKNYDVIKIDQMSIYHKMNLGTPHSIVRIRTPYDAVKSILLNRITITGLREYDLTKKEAQHCKRFIEGLPTKTLIQELSDVYECTEEEAKEYVNEFIDYAETYLSADDFDMNILSNALSRNPDLIELCKEQLTEEWRKENNDRIALAQSELDSVQNETQNARNEIQESIQKNNELMAELENIQKQIDEKEKLALEVEKKVALRIKLAKENAADFISQMAFLSPTSLSVKHDNGMRETQPVIRTCISAENNGEIDDIDTFEEELTENLTIIGYDEETAVEMAQTIGFCICTNTVEISKSIAATIGCRELLEIVINGSPITYECLNDLLSGVNGNGHLVFLIHGALDGYSVSDFNAISRFLLDNPQKVFIVLSIEGIKPYMIPSGVWNHAMYIDGDKGLTELSTNELKSFDVSATFEKETEKAAIKEKRKQLVAYSTILTNAQIFKYSSLLASYNMDLNKCDSVLLQIVNIGKSLAKEEELKSLFSENGISRGEKMLIETK